MYANVYFFFTHRVDYMYIVLLVSFFIPIFHIFPSLISTRGFFFNQTKGSKNVHGKEDSWFSKDVKDEKES